MALWTTLKAAVAAIVNTNGAQAITGANLQSTLNSVIDQVGANASYAGIAVPATSPGTPDGPKFYLCSEAGTYSNFAGYVHPEGGLSVLSYNGTSWSGALVFTGSQTPDDAKSFTLAASAQDHIELANDGTFTLTGQISIFGWRKEIRISSSSYPQSIVVSDYRNLTLDLDDPNTETTNYNIYDFSKIQNSTSSGSVGENNLILASFFGWAANTGNQSLSWGGLFASVNTIRNMDLIKRIPYNFFKVTDGDVTFSQDLKTCSINSELRMISRNGKILKLLPSALPHVITLTKDNVVCLDLNTTPSAENFQFVTYDETAIVNVIDYNFDDYGGVIPLVIEERLYNSGVIGGGLLFEAFYDKSTPRRIRDFGTGLYVASKPISDPAAKYAHDSQIYIKTIGGVAYRIVVYQLDTISTVEAQSTQFTKLIVFNHGSGEVLFDGELMKGGETYGSLTMPSELVVIPRMIDIGADTIRIVASSTSEIFYRDLTVSTQTLGDLNRFQVQIEGEGSPRDCDSAAMQAHLENTYADTSADYNGLVPLFRSNDEIEVVGGTWYLAFEASNNSDYTGKFVMLASSTDSGLTWVLHKPVENTAKTYGELTITRVGSTWHGLMRGNNGKYMYSSSLNDDDWTTPVDAELGLGQRHTVAKAVDKDGTDVWLVIYRKSNEITGHRTTQGIAKTYDFQTYEDVAIMNIPKSAHYPSCVFYAGALHVTYTTGYKDQQSTDRDTIMYFKFPLYNV